MAEFLMPSLGADMESAALVSWKVKPGDPIKRGMAIAEVETDKGVIEVEIFDEGVVEKLLAQPGPERIKVGTPLAVVGSGAPAPDNGKPQPPQAKPAPAAIPVATAAYRSAPDHHPMDHRAVAQAEAPAHARIQASPSARKLARELGVELTAVKGTGPHGVIQRADIERAAAVKATPRPQPMAAPKVELPVPPRKEVAPAAQPAGDQLQKNMRRAIAAAMSRANRDIPHYYLQTDIDVTHTLRWLEEQNAKRSVKERILPAVLLVKAVAKALVEVPQLNGYWVEDELRIEEGIHIGFAISLRQGGLIAPALHNADLLSLDELMNAVRDLIMRTRSNRLRSSELTDATITVSNLGDLGVETVYGVIYPPQVALVGFGKVGERPWAENGMLTVRKVLTATLAADHRASDGTQGAQFLEAIKRYLKEPDQL